LIGAGFETLVEPGYASEVAYLECSHKLKSVIDLIEDGCVANMESVDLEPSRVWRIRSRLAHRCLGNQGRDEARADRHRAASSLAWMLEGKVSEASFKATHARAAEHPIEEVGGKLRDMMP